MFIKDTNHSKEANQMIIIFKSKYKMKVETLVLRQKDKKDNQIEICCPRTSMDWTHLA